MLFHFLCQHLVLITVATAVSVLIHLNFERIDIEIAPAYMGCSAAVMTLWLLFSLGLLLTWACGGDTGLSERECTVYAVTTCYSVSFFALSNFLELFDEFKWRRSVWTSRTRATR